MPTTRWIATSSVITQACAVLSSNVTVNDSRVTKSSTSTLWLDRLSTNLTSGGTSVDDVGNSSREHGDVMQSA